MNQVKLSRSVLTDSAMLLNVTEDEDELSICQDGDDDREITVTDGTHLQSGKA